MNDNSPLPIELGAKTTTADFIAYNNQIMGEVLTLIDSALPESKQQKALKQLIKQSFWRNYDAVWRWMNKVYRIDEDEKETGKGQTYPDFPFQGLASVE